MHFQDLWQSEDLHLNLEGSELYEMIIAYRVNVENRYDVVKQRVFEIYPHVFDLENVFTLQNYAWGTAVLVSRSVWWNDRQHLVPLLDLVNCEIEFLARQDEEEQQEQKHREENEENEMNTEHDEDTFLEVLNDGSISVRTRRSYELGEDFREDYKLPNWHLYLHYGFVLPSTPSMKNRNPYDCLQVKLTLEEDENLLRKQRELQRRGMYETFVRACLRPGIVSSDVWIFLRVKYDLEDRDTIGLRVALYEFMTEKKSKYRTLMEDDFRMLSSASDLFPSNRHARTAVQFRFEEKKILSDIIQWLRLEIEEMGGRIPEERDHHEEL